MATTPEEMLASRLESIKESIIGFKFVTDSLLDRQDKSDLEIANLRTNLGRFENQGVRTDERIANIERYIESMRGDIRSVRNAVVGAIITAAFIGIAGLAITGISMRSHGNLPAVAGRAA